VTEKLLLGDGFLFCRSLANSGLFDSCALGSDCLDSWTSYFSLFRRFSCFGNLCLDEEQVVSMREARQKAQEQGQMAEMAMQAAKSPALVEAMQ
jgi:hypothetical protein